MGRKKAMELQEIQIARIRECMQELGLKSIDVAQAIGYTQQHFSRVLTGKSALSFEMASKLTDFFTNYRASLKLKEDEHPYFVTKYNYLYLIGDVKEPKTIHEGLVDLQDKEVEWEEYGYSSVLFPHILSKNLIVMDFDMCGIADYSVQAEFACIFENDTNEMFVKYNKYLKGFDGNSEFSLRRPSDGKIIELSHIEVIQLFRSYISAIKSITNQKFEELEMKQAGQKIETVESN